MVVDDVKIAQVAQGPTYVDKLAVIEAAELCYLWKGDQIGGSVGVFGSEKCHFVATSHQFLGDQAGNELRSSVTDWWGARMGGGELRYAHARRSTATTI